MRSSFWENSFCFQRTTILYGLGILICRGAVIGVEAGEARGKEAREMSINNWKWQICEGFLWIEKDILLTSFATSWGIQSFAKSLDWSKLHASCHSAWVKSICSVLRVNSPPLSGFDSYFDELLKVCGIQQETVNEISSPCVTVLFIPISLWMMSCHLPPQAAISMIYQCQCDQNANDDAGGAVQSHRGQWNIHFH